MKKIKIAFWILMVVFLALLMMQNQAFFFSKSSFSLDFYYKKYLTPELPNALLFLSFFFVGLLIAYISGLLEQYKSKRTVKDLKATLQSQMKVITDLKNDLAAKAEQIEQLTKSEEIVPPPVTSTDEDAPIDVVAEVEKEKKIL